MNPLGLEEEKKKRKNKNVRNLFKLKKENEAIKQSTQEYQKLFDEEEDYYKPLRVNTIWISNFI